MPETKAEVRLGPFTNKADNNEAIRAVGSAEAEGCGAAWAV